MLRTPRNDDSLGKCYTQCQCILADLREQNLYLNKTQIDLLIQMETDKSEELCIAIRVLIRRELLGGTLLNQILQPEYSWVYLILSGSEDQLCTNESVRGAPYNLITVEWLCRLFGEVQGSLASPGSYSNSEKQRIADRKKRQKAFHAIRAAEALTIQLTDPEMSKKISEEALACIRQTCMDLPLHLHDIPRIINWLARHHLLNEKNLIRSFGPGASDRMFLAVFSHEKVHETAYQLQPCDLTQSSLDSLFEITERRDATAAQSQGDIATAVAASVEAVLASLNSIQATAQSSRRNGDMQHQLTEMQTRSERCSRGAGPDEAERSTVFPTCQAFTEIARALISEMRKITFPNDLQERADALIEILNIEVDTVELQNDGEPYRPSEQMQRHRHEIETTLRELSENTSEKSALRILLESLIAFLRKIFCLAPGPKKQDLKSLAEDFPRFFSCSPGPGDMHGHDLLEQGTGTQQPPTTHGILLAV